MASNNSTFGGMKAFISASVAMAPLVCGATQAFAEEAAPPPSAQDAAADAASQEQEIVVTAQRREQALIDVPAAITAIGGDEVRELNVTNVPQIANLVPSFTITYERGTNTTPTFNLRGIQGDALASRLNESSIAIYMDDVYLGDENMLNGAVFDLSRVEILRGPQGTLFGRNTTGGLVNFLSATPTSEFSGHASALYGSHNTVTLEGAVSGPITDGIRARIAGAWDRHDGHYENVYEGAGMNGVPKRLGDKDVWGVRGTIEADLGPGTLLRITGLHTENHSQTTPVYIYGTLKPGTTGFGPYTRDQMCNLGQIYDAECIAVTQIRGGLPQTRSGPGLSSTDLTSHQLRAVGKTTGITSRLTHDFGLGTLTSITNYTKNRFFMGLEAGEISPSIVDTDFPAYVPRINRARQFSQELRMNGSSKAFDWVIGSLFYSDKKSNFTLIDANPPLPIEFTATARVKTRSYALFGQIDTHLNDQLTLSIGGRYTIDIRNLTEATTFNGANQAATFQDILAFMNANGLATKTNNKDFTGKIGLAWEPSDDATYYVSFSRGIKGAGFNAGFSPTNSIAANATLAGPVPQEVLDSLEIGAKQRLFDRKLSINSALFFYHYQGKQVAVANFDPVTRAAAFNFISAGTARVYGAETEIVFRPSRYFDIKASGALIGNKITKSDVITPNSFGELIPLQGKKLIATPKWTFNIVPAYHLPVEGVGEFTFQAEINGISRRNFAITNDPLAADPAHVFVNLRILWESSDGRYNAQAFVNNVFDEEQVLNGIDTVLGRQGTWVIQNNEGRLWGVKLGTRF